MRVKDLKVNDSNPRKITKSEIDKLSESIQRDPEFMKLRPIVIDDEGVILGGNQRFKALKGLGYKEVPDEWIARASDLTEEQKRRFIIVDNSPEGMSGEWDFDALKLEWDLPDLEDLGIDTRPLEEQVDRLKDGESLEFEKSVQLEPPKEYILIMCEPNSPEWEELKRVLKLKQVRRGGYKEGSAFDAVSLERVLWWSDFKKRVGLSDAGSNSK